VAHRLAASPPASLPQKKAGGAIPWNPYRDYGRGTRGSSGTNSAFITQTRSIPGKSTMPRTTERAVCKRSNVSRRNTSRMPRAILPCVPHLLGEHRVMRYPSPQRESRVSGRSRSKTYGKGYDSSVMRYISDCPEKGPILLVNLLQRSRSTFSWGSFLSFFAFKDGILDTQISALGG
jgi:hypothetical protein